MMIPETVTLLLLSEYILLHSNLMLKFHVHFKLWDQVASLRGDSSPNFVNWLARSADSLMNYLEYESLPLSFIVWPSPHATSPQGFATNEAITRFNNAT